MVFARKYIYAKAFEGEPKRTDIAIVEETLPDLQDNEYLAEALYISVDPYMRAYAYNLATGSDMKGGQIAKVIDSKHKDFPINALVYGNFGWRTHTVVNPEKLDRSFLRSYALPDFGEISPSHGLGILGMPGNTAYFGLLEVCKPKPGETLVVTGAAGAVGYVVGQIAKIMGCNVIGLTGSDEKCEWLEGTLGFDHAINYKTDNIKEALDKFAPKGIDCYFDNVGGEVSAMILTRMNTFGRVAICGYISSYNSSSRDTLLEPFSSKMILSKQLRIEGFAVMRWNDRWQEGIAQNLKWIQEGKLKCAEHTVEGFDSVYDAFAGMLRGENKGKMVVKL